MGRLGVQQAQWNLFLFILAILLYASPLRANCPAPCRCVPTKGATGGQEVSCNGKELKHLPVDFPSDMVSLDFSSNKLTRIPAGVFPALRNLRSLWLDNNLITHIEPFAFRGVHDYEILSIRRNKDLTQLTKYSFSGLRNIRNLILSENNISWIEKNTFYGTKQVVLLALYGNPLTEIWPSIFNNIREVQELRLPIGIQNIHAGAFYGLRDVQDLILEGIDTDSLKSETFFNLTNVHHLTFHDSDIGDISPRAFAGTENVSVLTFSHTDLHNIDPDVFDGAEKFSRLIFEKSHFSKIQLDFPEAVRHVADKVVYNANEVECCSISLRNLKVWRSRAVHLHWVNDFLHGMWCATPKWVAEESLHGVSLETLRLACTGALDRAEEETLVARLNQKPPLAELYKTRNSTDAILSGHIFLLTACLFVSRGASRSS